MSKATKLLSIFLVLFAVVALFAVVPVSATQPEYSASFKCTVGGSVPADCKFEIAINCYEMDESDEDRKPIKSETKVINTFDSVLPLKYTFVNNEVAVGGVYYQFNVNTTGNDLIVPDSRTITVYLCGGGIIKTADSAVDGEQIYDEIGNGLALDFEFKCSTRTAVSIDLLKSKPITKVYDGTTAVILNKDNYVLSGVAEGDDVSLVFTEGAFNSADVKKANKVTLKGLSLVGSDAGKYKLTDTKLECKGEITARPITVTADIVMMTKGTIEPKLTYQLSEPIIEGNEIIGSLARTAGNDVGEYAVTRGTLDFGTNYEVTFVDGKLIISNFTLTELSDSTTSINVSGYFNKNSKLSVEILKSDSAAYKYLKPGAAWGKILKAYDIKFDSKTHDGNFKIEIPVDSKYEGKEVAVYQQKSNGAIMSYKLMVSSGKVSFETDECTQFMLVANKDPEKAEETSVIMVILKTLLIIVLVVIGIVFIIALFFFGMVFFNKTNELKKIIRIIKRLLNKR